MDIEYCGTFLLRQLRTARKTYKCSECGEEILRGTKYEHLVDFDDKFIIYKTCPDCLSIRE